MEPITVETLVHASLDKVWNAFIDPAAIRVWGTASDDWHTVAASNDVRVGGAFTYRMEAKDGRAGFDMKGTYTVVSPEEHLAYTMDDGRTVTITFAPEGDAVRVTETFDPENENPREMQQAGWQAILDNFKGFVEN